MNVRTLDIQNDPSLNAVWQAYLNSASTKATESSSSSTFAKTAPTEAYTKSPIQFAKTAAYVGWPIYIGQQYDGSTGLNYLNARYYAGQQGQFISEDPVFLGDPKSQILEDPQSLNSYSYSDDNPITKKDPSGKQLVGPAAIPVLIALIAAYTALLALYNPATQQAMHQATYGAAQAVQSISIPAIHFGGSVIGVQSSPFSTPATQVIPSYSSNSSPSTNINFSKSGKDQGTPKPTDAPSGTKPIDQVGLPRGSADKIKKEIDARPNDWTGMAPNGDIITGTPDGKAINHGPIPIHSD